MAGRYLLDINAASYVIKGNIPRIRERLLKVPMAQLAISAVTEASCCLGSRESRRRYD
jgi:tRNA(fMet)-specific endonuclease VapC